MSTGPVSGSNSSGSSSSSSSSSASDPLQNLNLNQFLNLMIAELQNQDPLSPMDNTQILQEVGQMSQISSSNKLSTTLDSVLLGQNLTSASALIGKTVSGLTASGDPVVGKVDSVSIDSGTPSLHIGQSTIGLSNVREVLPDGSTTAAASTAS